MQAFSEHFINFCKKRSVFYISLLRFGKYFFTLYHQTFIGHISCTDLSILPLSDRNSHTTIHDKNLVVAIQGCTLHIDDITLIAP